MLKVEIEKELVIRRDRREGQRIMNHGIHAGDTIQTTTAASIFDTAHEGFQHEASTQTVRCDKSSETPEEETADHFEIVGAVEEGTTPFIRRG